MQQQKAWGSHKSMLNYRLETVREKKLHGVTGTRALYRGLGDANENWDH